MNPFTLAYPVNPFRENQAFGVNGAYYRAHGINILGHDGIDCFAVHGQPVYASHEGLAFWETDSNQGEGVVIITQNQFDYKGSAVFFKTIYWHLADYTIEPHYKSPVLDWAQKNKNVGMPVKKGDLIGFADNTGLSTGDHCHWALKPIKRVDNGPLAPEDATDIGNYENIEQLNGYLGAIDQTPYCDGSYANPKKDFLFDMGVYSISSDVLALQVRLGVIPAVSYLPVGVYGPHTRQAVIAYQAAHGILQTGTCGPITRASLARG